MAGRSFGRKKYYGLTVTVSSEEWCATKRVVEILDAKYDKADLPSIVKNNCVHLSTSHCNLLLAFLLKFEELFDGTLGD